MQRRIESIADGKLQKNRGCEKETKFHIRFDTYPSPNENSRYYRKCSLSSVVQQYRLKLVTTCKKLIVGKSETLVTCK